MFIPGFLITWATFPGVIVHELAHKIFCHLTGTRVLQVCYFRFGNPAGFVIHETPNSPWKHILIGFGPLVVNTFIGFWIAMMAHGLKDGSGEGGPLYLVLMYLAVSIAMHSFPSTGDASAIWHGIWKQPSSILTKVVGTPLVGLIWIGAIGSVMWLDLLYGIGICFWLPEYFGIAGAGT
jgi:hypothetical protein